MQVKPHNAPVKLLQDLFNRAIEVARPNNMLVNHLPEPGNGRVIIVGAGKASAAMAKVAEGFYGDKAEGIIVTRYGYEVICKNIKVMQAAHPVPDESGMHAATCILRYLKNLKSTDLVVNLVSGGGSALLPLPTKGLTLADKQDINTKLLKSGASISEINIVRRHLSAIKGGRLAAATHPAKLVNLIISDVPGDNHCDIASGYGVADPTTSQDAVEVLKRYRINVPEHILSVLNQSSSESIKPNDPKLANVSTTIIASAQMALEAAAEMANDRGYNSLILGDGIEGESREVANVMAGIARQVKHYNQPAQSPCVLLSGGETTVTIKGNGRGGRNVEFLLSLALALNGVKGIYALAGDTDGVDGQEEIAGAYITPSIIADAVSRGIDPLAYLDNNDAHTFFELMNTQLITGPTLTNVNDFRAILIT